MRGLIFGSFIVIIIAALCGYIIMTVASFAAYRNRRLYLTALGATVALEVAAFLVIVRFWILFGP